MRLDQAEVFQAAGGVHQLVGRNLDRDGEAVREGSAVNAPIVHQGHFDLFKDDVNAATIKLLGQVSDRKANAGRFHGDFSELFLPCQLRSRR